MADARDTAEGMDYRPVAVNMASDVGKDRDDLARYVCTELGRRKIDAMRQIIDVHADLDHAGPAEVVQQQHPVSQRANQPIGRLSRQSSGKLDRDLSRPGCNRSVTSGGFIGGHFLDPLVDGAIDCSVEVGDFGQQFGLGGCGRVGAVEVRKRCTRRSNEMSGKRSYRHAGEPTWLLPALGDWVGLDGVGRDLGRLGDHPTNTR